MNSIFKKPVGILFVIVSITSVLSLTLYPNKLLAVAEDRYATLQNFTKVLNLIQQYYVEEVDTKKLIYGGIKGMLKELDPHTNFLPPEIFKEFENETAGEFGGLGVEISVQQGVLTVISPIEDTPAFEAGVKPGDKIIAVDKNSTKGLSLVESAKLMKGPRGSKVVLTVAREGLEKPLDITIVRGSVKIRSVKYTDMEDGFAYVKITQFMETSAKDLKEVIDKHITKYKSTRGLILDLRRNPGGLFDQAIKISDYFLEKGIIVSTIGRDKNQKDVVSAKKDGTYPNFPIIVLMNQYSASASEIVAGALQDNQRAIVMGERSFGKGSVQSVVKLGDGSGLKLTIARYYTPKGISIQAEGIKPDIELENVDIEAFGKAVIKTENSREKDIQGHLKGDREDEEIKDNSNLTAWWNDVAGPKSNAKASPKDKIIRTDYQVYQAYNYLKAWNLMDTMNNKLQK